MTLKKNVSASVNNKNNSSVMPDSLDFVQLMEIIENSYDSIFVTDKLGNILLVNSTATRMMQVAREELAGANVNDLVKSGLYNRSVAMEAATTGTIVSGLVKMKNGISFMSTSRPLFDENGEVKLVITNTRDKDVIDKYVAALEEERAKASRYQTAVEYLSDIKTDRGVVAESPSMKSIIETVGVIAKVDSTILLFGESGTGKEVIARYIHKNSLRSKEPFIPVNCAAIPHALVESEFFGYVKGAFTGASNQGKPGLFEIADRGTLFLDEIGELPLTIQSKLLRVLETGEIQRLGSKSINQTNVRLLAATNRDLKQMVIQKLFRADLYYRLHVIPINIPPLRERPEDIAALAERFVDEYNRKYNLKRYVTPKVLTSLLAYEWPGNVRELRNFIERIVITTKNDELDFSQNSSSGSERLKLNDMEFSTQEVAGYRGTLKKVLKNFEANYIQQVLQECDGKLGEAAKRLGIHRTVLYRKLLQKE